MDQANEVRRDLESEKRKSGKSNWEEKRENSEKTKSSSSSRVTALSQIWQDLNRKLI